MSDLLKSLMSELDKEIGSNSEAQAVTKFINTGYPPLNKIISGIYEGGLPFGRLVEVFGESSSGKTALATQWMVNAQSMGGVAIFIDWERSFDVDMAQQMGLNTERPYWVYLRPRTWEEGNMQATKAAQIIRDSKVIDKDAPIIAVFDSIASAIPQSSAGKTIDELNMNDTSALARVTSTTLKVQAQYAADFDSTFVYLNQVREKIGVMFGDKTSTPGGKAMEFYASVRMSLSRTRIMEEKGKSDEKEMIGQNITIKCTKSKLTAPFKTCKLRLSFDADGMATFDTVTSLVDYLIDKKLLDGGAWVVFDGVKHQGRKNLVKYVRDNDKMDDLLALLA
jgi:protein RecA